MTEHLAWSKGGDAVIVSVDGDTIVVSSTTPAPPGARLEAILLAGGSPVAIKMKSYGTHKEDDGRFTMRGRLIEVTRDVRERLAALSSKSPSR